LCCVLSLGEFLCEPWKFKIRARLCMACRSFSLLLDLALTIYANCLLLCFQRMGFLMPKYSCLVRGNCCMACC